MTDKDETTDKPAPAKKKTRWRAGFEDITLEPPLVPETRVYKAGQECKDSPPDWPPQWLIDQGHVAPISEGSGT